MGWNINVTLNILTIVVLLIIGFLTGYSFKEEVYIPQGQCLQQKQLECVCPTINVLEEVIKKQQKYNNETIELERIKRVMVTDWIK